ncbi:MAG TPA: HEAT repeat domain-containing protein [Planctomycetota bacterium]|nr:HEAT repeat domain-containing protein [Planctomycetota bacterium]
MTSNRHTHPYRTCALSALLGGLGFFAAALSLPNPASLSAADGEAPAPAVTEPTPAPAPAPAGGNAAVTADGMSDETFDLLKAAAEGLGADDAPTVEKAKRRCGELAVEHKAAIFASLHDANALKKSLAVKLIPFVGDDAKAAKAVGTLLAGPNKDESERIRLLAAMALYNLPDPAGLEAALDALATDDDKKVRAAVAQALGKFNDERAVAPLMKALDDSFAQVRGNAASSLAHLKLQKDKVLEKLLNALDAEQDLTVKSRIQAAIATLQDRPDPKEADDGKDPLDVLGDLAGEMGTIEDKLRNDEHQVAQNAQVVEEQQNVVNKIDELVKKLEKQQQQSSSSSKSKKPGKKKPGPPKPGEGKPGEGEGKKGGGKTGGHSQEGAKESTLSADQIQYGEQGTLTGDSRAGFANLPDEERQALQNLRGKEVPEQWINVLESYWMSVNKIEAKEGAEGADGEQK